MEFQAMKENILSQWHEFRIPGILTLALALIAIAGSMMSKFPVKFAVFAVVGALFIVLMLKFPETLLAMFINAGQVKDDPLFRFPVDLTLTFGALTVFGILWSIKKGRIKLTMPPLKMALPFLLICLIAAISLMYTNNPEYGMNKFLRLAILTNLAFFGSFYLLSDNARVRNFMIVYVLFALVIAVSALTKKPANVIKSDLTSNYLTMGAIMAESFLMLFFYFFMTDNSNIRRAIYLLLISPGVLYVLMISGGRGPFIAIIMTLVFVMAFVRHPKKQRNIKIWILIILAAAGMYLAYDYATFTRMDRRMTSFYIGDDHSVMERVYMIRSSLNVMCTMPYFFTGLGIGGFRDYFEGLDNKGNMYSYPHDILLEMGTELGIFGLISIILFLYWSFKKGYFLTRKTVGDDYYTVVTIFSLFLFTLLNALKSGDINDHRLLFAFTAAIYSLDRKLNQNHKIAQYADGNYTGDAHDHADIG